MSPRPLTHDLFLSISEKSDLILDKVIIHKLEKGIFFSSITFLNKISNKSFIIDSRTSDAIAMAIRFNAPIYTYKKVLEKANTYLEKGYEKTEVSEKEKDLEEGKEPKQSKEKQTINKEDLEKKLTLAIQNEDYELAAKIRDQVNKLDE